MDKFTLNIWTTKLAVGSVWLLSTFLAVCAIYNIFPFVERLAQTATWSSIVALPVIVLSYSVGSVVIHLSNYFFSANKKLNEISEFVDIAKLEIDAITERYEEIRQEMEFLQAFVPTVIFLGLSVLVSSISFFRSFPKLLVALVILSILILLLVPLLKLLSRDLRNKLDLLVSKNV